MCALHWLESHREGHVLRANRTRYQNPKHKIEMRTISNGNALKITIKINFICTDCFQRWTTSTAQVVIVVPTAHSYDRSSISILWSSSIDLKSMDDRDWPISHKKLPFLILAFVLLACVRRKNKIFAKFFHFINLMMHEIGNLDRVTIGFGLRCGSQRLECILIESDCVLLCRPRAHGAQAKRAVRCQTTFAKNTTFCT